MARAAKAYSAVVHGWSELGMMCSIQIQPLAQLEFGAWNDVLQQECVVMGIRRLSYALFWQRRGLTLVAAYLLGLRAKAPSVRFFAHHSAVGRI
jgi:hypothetical protein